MGEGVFTSQSKFRPQAMKYYQQRYDSENLTFPLLVDKTTDENSNNNEEEEPIIVSQSYDILCYLWEKYGHDKRVTATNDEKENNINNLKQQQQRRRPDQIINSSSLPFIIRFLSLAGPSYLRPWPWCGLMKYPSSNLIINNR